MPMPTMQTSLMPIVSEGLKRVDQHAFRQPLRSKGSCCQLQRHADRDRVEVPRWSSRLSTIVSPGQLDIADRP
jgi:hypothetical protein